MSRDAALAGEDARLERLPEVLRRVERLEVRARLAVEGFLTGRHDSPYFGRSLEFREHRPYAPGDDPRHVDWKVLGRQDRLYVKRFDEETNLRATLLVDASASMAYRPSDRRRISKHEYAATAACALAYLLVRQHDSVSAVSFADGVVDTTTSGNRLGHVAVIAASLARPPAGAETALGPTLREATATLPGRGVVVLLSDLLAPVDELREGLRLLRGRHADAIVLQILDDDELDFPFEGPTRFVGLEGDATLDADPRVLRRRYLDAMASHLERVAEACAAERADYRLLRTSDPLDRAIAALLAARGAPRR